MVRPETFAATAQHQFSTELFRDRFMLAVCKVFLKSPSLLFEKQKHKYIL